MSGVRFSDATSGRASRHCSRSSLVIPGPPPVVSLMMMSGQASRIFALTSSQRSVVTAGRVGNSACRACTWTMDAPASYAPATDSAISSGVSGRFGFDSLPWMPPLQATQMIVGGMRPTRARYSKASAWFQRS